LTEVEQLLTDKDITFHSKGKDLLVVCLNPEHDDANPSMRIDREGGQFHCLSCGHKGNVFTTFNRYRNIFNSKVASVKKSIREIRKASWSGHEVPQDAFFLNEPFRGIPASIIQDFRAFESVSIGMEGRVVFPITDNMETIVGFQGRMKQSDAAPKYLMYPAEVSLPWYPSINKIQMVNNSIVLVEGLLDALYLKGKGMTNVVCMFGTKSVKFDNILEYLTPFMLAGMQTVYLMMDGDAAGRKANEHVAKCINHKTDLIVEVIPIADGDDPATLTDAHIEMIKKHLQSS
jgi:DNA primase